MVTDPDKIYSMHYTMCRKPWSCIGTGTPGGFKAGTKKRASAVNTNVAHLDHCMMMHQKWHAVRLDLENQLFELTGDASIREGSTGTYKKDAFVGHCTEDGFGGYLAMAGKEETYSRFAELYGS